MGDKYQEEGTVIHAPLHNHLCEENEEYHGISGKRKAIDQSSKTRYEVLTRNRGISADQRVHLGEGENSVDYRIAEKRLNSIDQNVLIPSKGTSSNTKDILKFPIESSHSYSYARLSPNSLALRLNVLKRSLEILKDRPDLIRSMNKENSKRLRSESSNFSLGEHSGKQQKAGFFLPGERSSREVHSRGASPTRIAGEGNLGSQRDYHKGDSSLNLRSNASSAALAALFRPALRRAETLPVGQNFLEKNVSLTDEFVNGEKKEAEDFSSLISLLETATLTSPEIASSLHDLSLQSNKENEILLKQKDLKTKLLYALATPFVETSAGSYFFNRDSGLVGESNFSCKYESSSIDASKNTRPFHTMYLNKHAMPLSIFTIESECPWSIKAANDIAFLMFGVLNGSLKSLTLMDLIAPQFREFVAEKINRSMIDSPRSKKSQSRRGKDIFFAGEIIAIIRPSDRQYAWTSMWAKRTGNLLICTFDLIPCDAFNVLTVLRNGSFAIEKLEHVAGDLLTNEKAAKLKALSDICKSIPQACNQDDSSSNLTELSGEINSTRYYTLHLGQEDENIPCALSSDIVENDDSQKLKLKIHALPYISGMFVIDSVTHNIVSCNNAISKNLFGRSSKELENKSLGILIPDFSQILDLGLKSNKSLIVVPGLVLPEHFFRKYDSSLQVISGLKEETEESLFLSSRGIKGLHRDGQMVWVDVQLRVPNEDYFILWITYSRQPVQSNNQLSNLKETQKPLQSLFEYNGNRNINSRERFRNEENIPSQLKLFPENEADLIELSPNNISRHGSFRRTFSSAPSFRSSLVSEEHDTKESSRINSFEDLQYKTDELYAGNKSEEVFSAANTNDGFFKDVYEGYSEKSILSAEDEMLRQKVQNSIHWPASIGNKRRTKSFSSFSVIKELGEGAYAKVVLAKHMEDPEYEVIIKCIDKEKILVDTWVRDRKLGTICTEIQIMAYLNNYPHPCIMRIVDFFEDKKYYYIESPVFGNPLAIDLFDYIEIKKEISEAECRFIFKQVALAIAHLHKHGIAHRDIKDENVIVDKNGLIKVIDFGSATYTKQGPFDVFVGTIDYASPEVLRGEKYTGFPQDVWALGILLYTILYKENPFYNVDEIMEGDLRIPYIMSETSVDLMKRILVRDVQKRPTISDILNHSWLR